MFEPVGRVLSNSQKSCFIEYVIAYPEKFRNALPYLARHYALILLSVAKSGRPSTFFIGVSPCTSGLA